MAVKPENKKHIKNSEDNEYNYKQELLQKTAFFESFKKATDESSIVSKSDLSGKITYANDNLCKICGYRRDELIGKPHSILRHPDVPKSTFKEMWETIKAKKTWKGTLKNKNKQGKPYWVDISISPILDENSEIKEYIAIRHDITKMIIQQHTLDNLAKTDTMTGLDNRYSLNLHIQKDHNLSLGLINIDDFSQINDFYGHEIGDQAIIALGDFLKNFIKDKPYFLFHLQGDEFVILARKTDEVTFTATMTELTKQIANHTFVIQEEELSINVTTALSFEEKYSLLASADMALKIAKKSNKSFLVYTKQLSLNETYKNNIEWTKKIKNALKEDNIFPVFQAITENSNKKIAKYECLVRLREQDKIISPFFFLDISKKARLYPAITKAVLQKSFEKFKNQDTQFSINLSNEDMKDKQTQDFIFSLLESHKIGGQVVFEIVESESIDNFDIVSSFIQEVKSFGCRIAIDDFGTGYSNFDYLLRLRADYIKIDGSMIKHIDTNKEAQLIVSTIVNFAKNIGMRTIAEFVETESIYNMVKELGVDYSQGYYFSKPLEDI